MSSPEGVATGSAWSYRPQLDGLRAVAVYLVVVFHCGVALFGGGFVGVDVFFVLSGFLVTSVILDEVRRTGTLRLGVFYARRVRRLLPAAVLTVVATCGAVVLLTGAIQRLEVIPDARAALLYVANWHFLLESNDYFSQDRSESPLLHFWSLAIEEQFYLVFPVLLVALVRRGGLRLLAVVVAALTVLSLASQLFWSLRDPNHAYYGTDARLYQLLAGVLLALALLQQGRGARASRVLLPLGGAALVVCATTLVDLTPGWRGLVACAAATAVVHGIVVRPESLMSRVLSRPLPVYLGTISYGTYLWHWPVIVLLREVVDLGALELLVVASVVSTALAALSAVVLETPIRRAPRLAGRGWSVVAAGLAVSVLAAVLVVPPVLESQRRPVTMAGSSGVRAASLPPGVARKADQPPPQGVDWQALLEDNGKGASCPAAEPSACVVVAADEGAPRVLLVGDSFANMLGPMFEQLAREKGFSLAQNIVQGCVWPEDLEVRRQAPEDREACAAARDGWYERALPELAPDLVVLVMRPSDASKEPAGNLRSRSGRTGSRAELLWSSMQRTVATLRARGSDVMMIRSIVGPNPERPLDCLSEATSLADCLVPYPQDRPPSDGYMQAMAAADDAVSVIDLDPLVCPTAPVCLPVRDGEIVWRDRYHLLTTYAEHIRNQVWEAMTRVGATRRVELTRSDPS